MRQVFTSPRLANVEGVARMLDEAGIEVRVTQGRSYKSGWSGRRTYRDKDDAQHPAVWVIRSDDQPRARQLLRDAGLLESTHLPSDSYLGPSLHAAQAADKPVTPERRALRTKVWLLLGIAAILALAFNTLRRDASTGQAPATPADTGYAPVPRARDQVAMVPVAPAGTHVVETPPALGEVLLAAALRASGPACVAIDGAAPAADVLARLRRAAAGTRAGKDCEAALPRLDATRYRTDGSGRGTVELRATPAGAATATRVFEVRRDGLQWQVLRELPAAP